MIICDRVCSLQGPKIIQFIFFVEAPNTPLTKNCFRFRYSICVSSMEMWTDLVPNACKGALDRTKTEFSCLVLSWGFRRMAQWRRLWVDRGSKTSVEAVMILRWDAVSNKRVVFVFKLICERSIAKHSWRSSTLFQNIQHEKASRPLRKDILSTKRPPPFPLRTQRTVPTPFLDLPLDNKWPPRHVSCCNRSPEQLQAAPQRKL